MLLPWVALVTLFTDGYFAQDLKQNQLSVTKVMTKSPTISCEVAESVSTSIIHWYKDTEGGQLVRILYFDGSVNRDSGFDEKFEAEKTGNRQYSLRITDLKPKDSATYYCAYWIHTALNSHSTCLQKLSTHYSSNSTPQPHPIELKTATISLS
ncbi:hypothetical protein scyTo_0021042 [Scyliorhinus torazame]|uniref:Ig-like domain-containing protein n=1 Tax=Scyliorhinus torazame TaxID=75743 RepID=A0A401PUR3_SCYTO|nr:hypothetical protein [Scyliorhinus torazame]